MEEKVWLRFFDDFPTPFVFLGVDERILHANRAFERLVGSGTIAGESLADRFGAERSAHLDAAKAMVHACGGFRGRLELRTTDGVERAVDVTWYAAAVAPFAARTAMLLQDVTEKEVERERTLALLERRGLAIAASNDGVWDWDVDAGSVECSDRFLTQLGIPHSEGGPTVVAFADLRARVHPADLRAFDAAVETHLADQSPTLEVEVRLSVDDGWMQGLFRGQAARRGAGKPYRVAGSLSDVTSARTAQRQAAEQQAALAHAHRLASLGELAAGVAHELNHPLGTIVNYSEGCLSRLHGPAPIAEHLAVVLEVIVSQARLASEIIARVRSYLAPSDFRRNFVDANAAVRQVLELTDGRIREAFVAVDLNLAPELPPISADDVQLQQVLVNLLLNAVDALAETPVGDRRVSVRTFAERGGVGVEVADNGPGVPDDVAPRIFDAFVTTKGQGGLGLGLSIARRLTEEHGGRLWLDALAAPGAHFRVWLPAAEIERAPELELALEPQP